MELKNLREHWAGFPVVSMEERPVLSSEMEMVIVKNPFPEEFYLRSKILLRILIAAPLLLIALYQVYGAGRTGEDLYPSLCLAGVLAWFITSQMRLLLFADYPSLASLSLIPFLTRVENIFRKYIHSFRILSLLAGFYLQICLEWGIRACNANMYQLIRQNNTYRILFIAFLSVSVYILLLHFRINKYKKWMIAVRSYKEGISDTAKKH